MYTVEFHKRGLPHEHILLWLDARDKINSIGKIDYVVCAEFPCSIKYPKLFEVVSMYIWYMVCVVLVEKNSPCRKNGKCFKFFPVRDITIIHHELE